jgi:branched-chain amino acid aminotransferase
LHTPTPLCFLDGITRQTAISIAEKQGIKVVQRDIYPEEIKDAQEIFLTGSAVEINPVRKIDDLEFKVGKVTSMISNLYLSEVDKNYKIDNS